MYADPIKHSLSSVWKGMMRRCYDRKHKNFKRYGGRGITVYKRWHKFRNFFQDNRDIYSPGLWFDRKDNDVGYKQANCRWVTPKESQRNKRNNKLITANGTTKTLAAWAEDLGTDGVVISDRLRRGWAPTRAVSEPPYKRIITVDGETKRISEWARISGIDRRTIAMRIKEGWTAKEAVTTPKYGRYVKSPGANTTPF